MSEPNLNDILSGGGLSSLLQNPEVAAKLPRIMEALGPVMAEMKAEQAAAAPTKTASQPTDEESQAASGEATEAIAKVLPTLSAAKKESPAARRRALLCALEPYLSDNRREAMDYIGKVLSLIDILSEVI